MTNRIPSRKEVIFIGSVTSHPWTWRQNKSNLVLRIASVVRKREKPLNILAEANHQYLPHLPTDFAHLFFKMIAKNCSI